MLIPRIFEDRNGAEGIYPQKGFTYYTSFVDRTEDPAVAGRVSVVSHYEYFVIFDQGGREICRDVHLFLDIVFGLFIAVKVQNTVLDFYRISCGRYYPLYERLAVDPAV